MYIKGARLGRLGCLRRLEGLGRHHHVEVQQIADAGADRHCLRCLVLLVLLMGELYCERHKVPCLATLRSELRRLRIDSHHLWREILQF